jgi:hypothetical protein
VSGMTTYTEDDTALAIATLSLAFSTDPGARWLLPDTDRCHRDSRSSCASPAEGASRLAPSMCSAAGPPSRSGCPQEHCNRDGLPAYLESGNPRNRLLYERLGFVATGEVQVAGAPPVWPMLRPPLS